CVPLVECAVVLFLSLHRAHAGWFGRSGGQRSKTVGNESGGTAHDRCCRRESSREWSCFGRPELTKGHVLSASGKRRCRPGQHPMTTGLGVRRGGVPRRRSPRVRR